MSAPPPVALVVHGHFYQPPRENPWTDEVPVETAAAPFRDWNDRIHAECYRPNAAVRMTGAAGSGRRIANNYARMSFNFGPTLARWIARADPWAWARVRAADRAQQRRLGHGGAIAQLWGHAIAPLLSHRDLRTQIRWGLDDFRPCFGRAADGIWLPETAVNAATLDALIDAGVRFTVLAPEQIAAVRQPGRAWTAVTRDSLDTGRAYRWVSEARPGRSIALCVFDGPLSRELAFGHAVRDAPTFMGRVRETATRSAVAGRRLVLAASDGELYGHHRKFADLTLAHATAPGAPRSDVVVTNLAAFLEEHPAEWEAELTPGPGDEGTAWSCTHGVGRWRRHCGCAMHAAGDTGWTQAWRAPLRAAMDILRDRAAAFFDDAGDDLFQADPWAVRDGYGAVVEATAEERERFVRGHGRAPLRAGNRIAVRRACHLLEMQRAALLMYASCGWYFDDVAGAETSLIVRQAAHAIDLWRSAGGRPPERAFVDTLGDARSNDAKLGTGADVYRRACRDRVTPESAVAHAALARLARARVPDHVPAGGFEVDLAWTSEGPRPGGTATAFHRRSGTRASLRFSAATDGLAAFECTVGARRVRLDDLDTAAASQVRRAALHRLAELPAREAVCRAALGLARQIAAAVPPAGDDADDAIRRLLARWLTEGGHRRASRAVLDLASALADHAALPASDAPGLAIEEWLWDRMEDLRARKRALPRALTDLAQRLDLAVPRSD